jgi:hypothetical protein
VIACLNIFLKEEIYSDRKKSDVASICGAIHSPFFQTSNPQDMDIPQSIVVKSHSCPSDFIWFDAHQTPFVMLSQRILRSFLWYRWEIIC